MSAVISEAEKAANSAAGQKVIAEGEKKFDGTPADKDGQQTDNSSDPSSSGGLASEEAAFQKSDEGQKLEALSKYYIDFASGDQAAYDEALAAYGALSDWLGANAASYGLPAELRSLDEVGRETLASVYEGAAGVTLSRSSFSPPQALTLPRLTLSLSPSPGLAKTTANFVALLTDAKSLESKRSPHPPLRYAGCPVHRIEEGFVAQGGDVTRGDGSGGESIYGGTFNDEKEGLKTAFAQGTIAMANSGKNSNTSQFFVTLASSPDKLKKLTGKYVAFGQADLADPDTAACLARLDGLGDGQGGTREKVWIQGGGLL